MENKKNGNMNDGKNGRVYCKTDSRDEKEAIEHSRHGGFDHYDNPEPFC